MSGERGVGLKGWLSGPRRYGTKTEPGSSEVFDKQRIAVLPLSNVSPDPRDEYFADGMTDEMISTISKIEGLEVISRTSVMRYKKHARLAREVSQTLSVGTILEGSVRKAGNKLRITVQLIDATKDKHLWSNSYDREIQDVFAIQTDIAESVADALKLQLLGEKRAELRKRTSENVGAYSLYLKGRFYWNERNPESVKKAMQYFESAIAKDPKFAIPYVGLADCYIVQMDRAILDENEFRAKARSLLDAALRIDNRLAEAHVSSALLLDLEWNWGAARAEYLKAIELNPNYATVHQWYSLHLSITDHGEESLREIKIALRLDPISPVVNVNFGLKLVRIGQVEEGIEWLERTVASDSEFGLAHAFLGQVYVSQSRFQDGIAELQIANKIAGGSWVKALLAYACALSGERSKALEFLAVLEADSKTRFVPVALLAVVNFALGDKEKAFSLFEKAFEERCGVMRDIKTLAIFERIRADPRFMNVLKKMTSN